jgi:hypothetical protein
MTDAKKKAATAPNRQNVLETLKDLGGGTLNQTRDLLRGTAEDFFRELVGIRPASQKASGKIDAGESINLDEVLNGRGEEVKKLKQQIFLERKMTAEENRLKEEKIGKLKIELQVLASEIIKLAASSQELAKETEIAMIEAPANPGVYHLVFFEKVLEFIQSFRKKIENATFWLEGVNKRARKKNYWSMYKKKGSSFLLSPDHYLQRSAG